MKILFRGRYETTDADNTRLANDDSRGSIVSWLAYSSIVIVFFLGVLLFRTRLTGDSIPNLVASRWALLFVVVSMPIHEFLHVIVLPRQTTVNVFFSLKFPLFVALKADVYLSRCRAALCAALPMLVLGFLPFTWYLLFFEFLTERAADFLLTFSVFSVLTSVGDLEVLAEIIRTPKGEKVPMF